MIVFIVLTAPLVFRTLGFTGFVLNATAGSILWLTLVSRSERWRPSLSLRSVLIIAVLLRVPFWLTPPDLSGDLWRYLWDGTVSLSGLSPYSAAPDDPSLDHLRADWHHQINHPEIPTIYPPYAQLLFLIPAAAGGSVLAWRILLLLIELTAVHLLYRHSASSGLLWALFPLAIWEGHWSAHVDLAAATLLLVSVIMVSKPLLSGSTLGIAVGIKIIPIIALPALLWNSNQRLRRLSAFVVSIAVGTVPFLGGAFMPGATDYVQRWSFNGPVYVPVVRMIELVGIDRSLRSLWAALGSRLGLETVSATVYGLIYSDLLARAVLGALLILGVTWIVRRSSDVPTATADSLGLLLILSPTVHPWYWLPASIIALVVHRSLWLFLASGSLLSYLLYESVDPLLVLALSYVLPLLGWLGIRRAWRESLRQPEPAPAPSPRQHVPARRNTGNPGRGSEKGRGEGP